MKAEIGFVRNWDDNHPTLKYGQTSDRLELVVRAESRTEVTALIEFAKRMGWSYDESSAELTIQQPAGERSA